MRIATTGADFADVDLGEFAQYVLAGLEVRIEETAARVELGHLPCVHRVRTQLRRLLQ